MDTVPDHRCLSSAEVAPGELKRCVRVAGHVEAHLWVEAVRSDGSFDVARWDDQRAVRVARAREPR